MANVYAGIANIGLIRLVKQRTAAYGQLASTNVIIIFRMIAPFTDP